jgi:hypothetical protein
VKYTKKEQSEALEFARKNRNNLPLSMKIAVCESRQQVKREIEGFDERLTVLN